MRHKAMRYFVRFKNIGRHTGAVAYVIAYQVGYHGGVARIIFRDTGFNFPNEVGSHVSGFGVNTTAHAHEKREERTAETEPQQGIRCSNTEDNENNRTAKKT